jgi:BlaI family transcriptional regulator, penicillinase repressor
MDYLRAWIVHLLASCDPVYYRRINYYYRTEEVQARDREPRVRKRNYLFVSHICSRHLHRNRSTKLPKAKLSKLEFQIMNFLWSKKEASIREIQEAVAQNVETKHMPAYTTIQTTVYRMEAKTIVRRVRKVGNFHTFAAIISRKAAQRRLLDDLLGFFAGNGKLVMAQLIQAGELTLEDVKEAEAWLESAAKKKKAQ